MLPFIHVFGHDVPMYGLLMLTGMTLAVLLACLRGGKRGLDRLDILLASIFAFLGGLLGAKVLFIITDIPNMVEHIREYGFSIGWIFNRMISAGIVFYGGLIGGLFGGWVYTRLFYIDFWKHADAMIPFLPLGHAFGRLGCFCAGCCYGKQMPPPWGWHFNSALGGADPKLTYFPSQLLEAGFNLLILFPLMMLFSRKERKPGQIVGLYMVSYGIFRFVNEFFRGDEIRGIFLGVSTSQWVSLALVPIGAVLLSGVISEKLRRELPVYEDEYEEYEEYDEDENEADEETGEEIEDEPSAE